MERGYVCMNKVPRSKKSGKGRSSQAKKSGSPHRGARTSRGSSKEVQVATVDTYEAWLENQVRRRKHASGSEEAGRSSKTGEMPVDTMEEWLRKQPVAEKQERVTTEVKLPPGSTEEWLRKQVSDRLSKPQEEEEEEKNAGAGVAISQSTSNEAQSQPQPVAVTENVSPITDNQNKERTSA